MKRSHTLHRIYILFSEKIKNRKVKFEQKLILFLLTFRNEPFNNFNAHLILLLHIEVQDYEPNFISS